MEVISKEIKGVNLKQIIGLIIGVAATVGLYFDLRNSINHTQDISNQNNQILQEIRSDRKEDNRVNNIRLSDVENKQRTDDIRLTIIETQLKVK